MRFPSALEPLTVQVVGPGTALPDLTAVFDLVGNGGQLALVGRGVVERVAVLVDADLLEDGRVAGLDDVGPELGQYCA